MITTVLGFLSLVGWVIVIAGAGLAISNASQNRSTRPGILLALLGLVIGIAFFIISSGLIVVESTQVAVIFQSVGGDPKTNNLWAEPIGPGVHVIVPIINEPFFYTTETQNYTMSKTLNEGQKTGQDDSVQVRSKDGQQVYIDISILYSISPKEANQVHLKYRNRYEEDFVRPTVRSVVRDVVSGYNAEDVYGDKRTEIQQKIKDGAKDKFVGSGLILSDLLMRNVTFSDDFIKAVEAKKVAQQQAEQAIQEAERARTLAQGRADADVTAASGEAKAAVERAKGDAQAIELRAAADAKALALISEQISKDPLLVQWRYIEKLAPTISMILVPSSSPYLFDLQSLMGQGKSTVPTTPSPTPAAK